MRVLSALFLLAPALALVWPAAPARRRVVVALRAKAKPTAPDSARGKTVARNRRATFDYEIVRKIEAGIALAGTEVKSCRAGKVALRDGFARVDGGSCFLHNVDIAPHATTAAYFQHESLRKRRLLLHKAEIRKLGSEVAKQGATLIPLRFYFNARNVLKVELALCRGKNVRDKREDVRRKDEKRVLDRIGKTAGLGGS